MSEDRIYRFDGETHFYLLPLSFNIWNTWFSNISILILVFFSGQ